MNEKFANDALVGLRSPGFETVNGFCARWTRQVCEFSYGDARFNSQWRPDDSPTAAEAARAFVRAGYGATGELQVGDILFKTTGSGGAGHVGILTSRGVAENSTFHWNRSGGKDARGVRSLAAFGAFQVVVRLPPLELALVAPKPPEAKPLEPSLLEINWNGRAFTIGSLIELGGHTVEKITERLDETPPKIWVRSYPTK